MVRALRRERRLASARDGSVLKRRLKLALSDLELLTIGRVSVDLYAEQLGVPLAAVQTFAKSVGGSPTNVAVAAARMGRRSAVATAVGEDEFGNYVRGALAGFGVDTRFVGSHPTLRTPIVVAAMDPPDDPTFVFYREPAAPDEEIGLTDELEEAARSADIFWVTGSALAGRVTGPTTRELMTARTRARHTVLDLDYRPTFWPSEADARREIGSAVDSVTVAVGNRRECEVAVGTADPHAAADALLARGVELAVVKLGGEGVLVATADERSRVEPVPVEVVCGLGAGDAFGGALCHALLTGESPVAAVRFANAAGAIVASRLLCADAMPTRAEVEELLGARA
jgi:5-dehydro-2-deoxygluconokinase